LIVVDASAAAFALLDDGETGERCRAALRADSRWLVPGHWLIEVLSVIRGNLLGGKIKPDRAEQAAAAAAELDPVVVPARLVAARIWELRGNLTTYDAAYVAVAERYRCALVTTDARLGRAPGIQCAVTLIH
jgi:predicted nucleic acid-binding protein